MILWEVGISVQGLDIHTILSTPMNSMCFRSDMEQRVTNKVEADRTDIDNVKIELTNEVKYEIEESGVNGNHGLDISDER